MSRNHGPILEVEIITIRSDFFIQFELANFVKRNSQKTRKQKIQMFKKNIDSMFI